MRVKCKWKQGDEFPASYVYNRIPSSSKEWHLTTGKEYVVYGLECYEGQTWYYVVDEHNLWFPIMKPAPLFEIVDGRPSAFWKVSFRPARNSPDTLILSLAFEEWVTEDSYYERLADKNPREVTIFAERKKQMDAE
jgi:hypothetical protein